MFSINKQLSKQKSPEKTALQHFSNVNNSMPQCISQAFMGIFNRQEDDSQLVKEKAKEALNRYYSPTSTKESLQSPRIDSSQIKKSSSPSSVFSNSTTKIKVGLKNPQEGLIMELEPRRKQSQYATKVEEKIPQAEQLKEIQSPRALVSSPRYSIEQLRKNGSVHQSQSPENFIFKNKAPFKKSQYYVKNAMEMLPLFKAHLANALKQTTYLQKQMSCLKYLPLEKKYINTNHFQKPKTIVIDMDETLLRTCTNGNDPYDYKCEFQSKDNTISLYIKLRPYALEFIKSLSNHFNLVIFTAGYEVYANKVLDFIDPDKKLISLRVFREHQFRFADNVRIKDIRIFSQPLSKICLIDNVTLNFGAHIDNGIPIIPYFNGDSDTQLIELQEFILTSILPANDVRDPIKEQFKFSLFPKYKDIFQILDQIYK